MISHILALPLSRSLPVFNSILYTYINVGFLYFQPQNNFLTDPLGIGGEGPTPHHMDARLSRPSTDIPQPQTGEKRRASMEGLGSPSKRPAFAYRLEIPLTVLKISFLKLFLY